MCKRGMKFAVFGVVLTYIYIMCSHRLNVASVIHNVVMRPSHLVELAWSDLCLTWQIKMVS